MNTPQIDDVLIFLGQLGAAIIAIAAALGVIHRVFFKKLTDKIDTINKELHPNHGSSLRDAVNRIEQSQAEIKQNAKEIRAKIDDHIEWHLDN
jgi:hypothetical protein